MTRTTKLGLVGFLVVAGAAVTVWRMRGDDAPTPKAPAAAARPAAPDRPVARTERNTGASVEADLPVLVDDDPVGALRLEGQVVDAAQAPVGGAVVVLAANPPRTVTTEADGGFVFDRLVGRPYTLVARASTGVAGPVTARLTATSDPVILTLRAAGSAKVHVVDEAGAAVANAAVELRGVDVQASRAAGDGKAAFAPVVPGRYEVVAWADGFARSYGAVTVGTAIPAEVTIALVRGAPVSGRVVTESGTPLAGATVTFSGASEWRTQADPRRDGATTDAQGAFRFEALGAGSVRFTARHESVAPGTSELITLDGRAARDGVTIRVSAGALVRGRVLDAGGAPVPGARVRVAEAGRGVFTDGPRQAYSDADGAFSIAGLPRKKLRAVAVAEAGASATVDVDASAGDVPEVKLTIEQTGTIRGVVVDVAGEPIEGVQVSAGPDFSSGRPTGDMTQWRLRGFPEELTDGAGRFTLTGLAPGSYRLRANRSRVARRGPRGGADDGVVAEAGAQDVKIVLAAEGAVTGKVALTGGATPGPFTVGIGFGAEPGAADGRFTLEGLSPGNVEVTLRGIAFDTKAVPATIRPGETTDLGTIEVVRGRTVGGVVVADGVPVEGATVYVGRQIFGSGTSGEASTAGGGPPMARATKKTTTGADGGFTLSGFGSGDLTVVAEHPQHGRSQAQRLLVGDAAQGALRLSLEAFGALRGELRQGGEPQAGVIVNATPADSPGAIFSVGTGPDGTFRFDRLAQGRYRVSAMIFGGMMGMRTYSQEVAVTSGQETVVALTMAPGALALDVTATPRTGALGIVSFTLASGVIAASTARDLELQVGASGAGNGAWRLAPMGGKVRFEELTAGTYSVCAVPLPAEIQGMAGMGYFERHGSDLPAACQQVELAAAPATQAMSIVVDVPAVVAE